MKLTFTLEVNVARIRGIVKITIIPSVMNFYSQIQEIFRELNSMITDVQENKRANATTHEKLKVRINKALFKFHNYTII